ncbi:hypothetical protein, partial [Turicimonas muris]
LLLYPIQHSFTSLRRPINVLYNKTSKKKNFRKDLESRYAVLQRCSYLFIDKSIFFINKYIYLYIQIVVNKSNNNIVQKPHRKITNLSIKATF